MRENKIFALGDAQDLARNIFNCNEYEDSKIPKLVYNQPILKQETFANGELYIEFLESIRNDVVILVSRINNHDDLFRIMVAADAARRSNAKEVILIAPFLAYGRQERRDGKRTSITSRLISDMLTLSGIDHVITLDIHSQASEGFYKIPVDNVLPINLFVPLIKNEFEEDFMLVSPDMGFVKKMKQFKKALGDNLDMAILNKERLEANKIESIELYGNVKGRNVIMMDDMVDTGTTLIKGVDLLKENGALNVSVFVTHPILSGNAIEKIEKSQIDELFVTDSILLKEKSDKIIVLSSAGILFDTLKRVLA